jgi:tripartite-type tricarboxylate transporter receptor subunit TctC
MKKILLLLLFAVSTVSARDIRLIVPFSPGGSSDQVARVLEPLLSNSDYTFVIEYRLGAGGSVAADHVARTRDETVVMVITPGLIGNPIINGSSNYNVMRDFVLVQHIGIEPLLVVTSKKSGIANYKKFEEASRTQIMPYGSAGTGTSSHISAAIIANNNTNLFNVPYKGSSAVLADLITNRVTWTVDSDIVLGPHMENSLTPIAVYARRRMPKYPTVPTLKELKINDQDFYRWHIMVANATADPAVIAHLQERFRSAKVIGAIEALGIDATPIANPDSFFKNETVKLQRIVRDYHITP